MQIAKLQLKKTSKMQVQLTTTTMTRNVTYTAQDAYDKIVDKPGDCRQGERNTFTRKGPNESNHQTAKPFLNT